jgi:hypothetical protein
MLFSALFNCSEFSFSEITTLGLRPMLVFKILLNIK